MLLFKSKSNPKDPNRKVKIWVIFFFTSTINNLRFQNVDLIFHRLQSLTKCPIHSGHNKYWLKLGIQKVILNVSKILKAESYSKTYMTNTIYDTKYLRSNYVPTRLFNFITSLIQLIYKIFKFMKILHYCPHQSTL